MADRVLRDFSLRSKWHAPISAKARSFGSRSRFPSREPGSPLAGEHITQALQV